MIEQGLYEANSFFSGDRVLLWEVLGDGQKACLTHSYIEAGADPPAQTFLHETLPYIFGSVCSQEEPLRVPAGGPAAGGRASTGSIWSFPASGRSW